MNTPITNSHLSRDGPGPQLRAATEKEDGQLDRSQTLGSVRFVFAVSPCLTIINQTILLNDQVTPSFIGFYFYSEGCMLRKCL